MTLGRFAYRVAGPRDAVINLVLNTLIPWAVLRNTPSVALRGLPSVEVFLGVMCFLLFLCATFFGIMNGVIVRKSGAAGEPLAADTPWRGWALAIGLLYGCTAAAAAVLGVRCWAWYWPEARVSSPAMIGMMAGSSTVLGYVVQVHGVLKSARLKSPPTASLRSV